jgi:hypothetical protein
MVWGSRGPARARRPNATALLDAAGVAGLAGILGLVGSTDSFSSFLYPDGLVLLALATAVLVAAVVNPASRLGLILGCPPLRWIGVRSYGIYLWQWPIIVLASNGQTAFDWRTATLEVAGTFLVAGLSWRYVENPVRHGALRRLWRNARSGASHIRARRRAFAFSTTAAAAVLLPIVCLTGLVPAASTGIASATAAGRLRRVAPIAPRSENAALRLKMPPAATRSSCQSVVYIGDSTSEGEISTDYIPNPRRRLKAQLADVGVKTTIPEISGARSIVETYEGSPNAATVAKQHIADGFRGCWILALGTNEVDNLHTGSTIGYASRIRRMMSIIGQQPVLWATAVTLRQSGPYSERYMQDWNRALLAACPRYPTMRLFDWAAWAKPRWFIPDGIHYYSPGYVAKTHRSAQALAHAFPAGQQPSSNCVVR